MRPWIPLFVASFALLPACNEEKKPPPSAPKAPEPIPSDFEVNSFLGSGPPSSLKVKDDGGIPALPVEAGAGGGATAQTDGSGSAAGASASPVKLLEPGDEPRAVRKYDLKTGRTESLAVTIKSTMTQELPGQPPQTGAQPGMVFSVAVVPTAKDPGTGDTDIKVTYTKADVLPTSEADPMQAKQLAQAFRMLAGQTATFRLGSHGAVTGFTIANEKIARSDLAALAQQAVEGLFVAFPAEPIGKGAKWQESSAGRQEGISATVTTTYTLTDVAPDGLVVGINVTRKAAPQPLPDPRAPKGTTVALDGTSNGQVKARVDRFLSKGSMDSSTSVTINQAAAGGMQPKPIVQKVSLKQTIDNSTP